MCLAAPAGHARAKDIRQDLSSRENEILKLLRDGASNKAIARSLNLAESTVKVHLKSLMRKLDAGNRTQAAIWGLDQPASCAAGDEGDLD
jgi:two-component system nitrate/nitrite response regulator NarL